MNNNIILECKQVSKFFPGVKALDSVNLILNKGEVHALCGENGAGKSTLMKIIAGLYQRDEGEIYYDGKLVNYNSPQEGRKNGIVLIPQEIQLAETLTVAENIFMTGYPTEKGIVSWKKMHEMTVELQAQLGSAASSFKPEDVVRNLSMGQRQMVEILKAISTEAKIIAFDEPTSSLSDEETASMFKLIHKLVDRGITIIYVSHRLAEIFEICDKVSVFKDGKYIGTRQVSEVKPNDIVTMMVGRELSIYKRQKAKHYDEVALEVKNLRAGKRVRDISFQLKKGEVLGVFGIVGSGRTETANLIFGVDQLESGEIYIHGEKFENITPAIAVKHGIGYVTEDRRGQGLALVMSVGKNITLPFFSKFVKSGVIRLGAETETAEDLRRKLNIKTASLDTVVGNLSGGNQQKVVISKWIGANSDIYIFDEPTRGIDVGAKSEIYHLINDLTSEGNSVLMISSELPEVLSMSDRLLVFRDGEIVKEFSDVQNLTEENVLNYAIKTSK